jgi:hypothetical protein
VQVLAALRRMVTPEARVFAGDVDVAARRSLDRES